ncbi:MAG: asparaginase [Phycisphaerae bacterium]
MNIAILTTGGTIEKVYNEADGSLRNAGSVLEEILGELRLPDLNWRRVSVMSKDSLDMDDRDRRLILQAVRETLPTDVDAVLVVHGTDTLTATGDVLHAGLPDLTKPVILVGAMRPYEFRDTDAYQNMTEALLAARLAPPGVYVVMHNQVLRFPGVVKDRTTMTFRRATPQERPKPAPARAGSRK